MLEDTGDGWVLDEVLVGLIDKAPVKCAALVKSPFYIIDLEGHLVTDIKGTFSLGVLATGVEIDVFEDLEKAKKVTEQLLILSINWSHPEQQNCWEYAAEILAITKRYAGYYGGTISAKSSDVVDVYEIINDVSKYQTAEGSDR